jgi:hypothetical protein
MMTDTPRIAEVAFHGLGITPVGGHEIERPHVHRGDVAGGSLERGVHRCDVRVAAGVHFGALVIDVAVLWALGDGDTPDATMTQDVRHA